MRQLSEKVLEKWKQMVVACTDLEKVHDTVRGTTVATGKC